MPSRVSRKNLGPTFIGDYYGPAMDTQGRVHATWTDTRRVNTVAALGTTGNVSDVFYARR